MRKTTKMKLSAILGAAAILVAGGAFAMTNNTTAKAEDTTPTLKFKGAKSVRTCTLLDKPDRRVTDFVPDYTGVMIPDEFVVGYGLDYDEKYRTLPYIGILKPEVYKK